MAPGRTALGRRWVVGSSAGLLAGVLDVLAQARRGGPLSLGVAGRAKPRSSLADLNHSRHLFATWLARLSVERPPPYPETTLTQSPASGDLAARLWPHLARHLS